MAEPRIEQRSPVFLIQYLTSEKYHLFPSFSSVMVLTMFLPTIQNLSSQKLFLRTLNKIDTNCQSQNFSVLGLIEK